jgi:hypothetical protein
MTAPLLHQPGAAERSAPVPASSDDPTTVAERARIAHVIERALSAMEPMVERIVDDASVSAEHALHVVVMDPTRDARTPFDASILVERSYGDPSAWKADYAWYARAKARVSWRERRSLRTLLTRCADRLQPDDIRVEGAVRQGRFVVAASGAQPWYDHAVAMVAIQLFEAGLAHERIAAAMEGSRQ